MLSQTKLISIFNRNRMIKRFYSGRLNTRSREHINFSSHVKKLLPKELIKSKIHEERERLLKKRYIEKDRIEQLIVSPKLSL